MHTHTHAKTLSQWYQSITLDNNVFQCDLLPESLAMVSKHNDQLWVLLSLRLVNLYTLFSLSLRMRWTGIQRGVAQVHHYVSTRLTHVQMLDSRWTASPPETSIGSTCMWLCMWPLQSTTTMLQHIHTYLYAPIFHDCWVHVRDFACVSVSQCVLLLLLLFISWEIQLALHFNHALLWRFHFVVMTRANY